MADAGMDSFAVISEIAPTCWAMAISYGLITRLFQDVVQSPLHIEDIKIVAHEYGHWTFEQSCEKYTEAHTIIQAAIELCLLSFRASNTYKEREKLFERVAHSPLFEINSDANSFLLQSGRKYVTTRLELYKAWHTIHYPISYLYQKAVTNDCKDTADLYEHLEDIWSDEHLLQLATTLRTAINVVSREAGRC